jgi:WD40 repeat protein
MAVKDHERTLASEEYDSTPLIRPTPVSSAQPELTEINRGHYLIEGEHARGGLGRILEAYDQRLDRPVAIKELIDPRGDAIARFVREALVTARLQHPSIVPVYEAGRWPTGEPFYAMKLVTGRSLKDIIAERRSLDERLALVPNVIAVADALAYAHSMGIIHRDIKPSNVLIGSFGETVVIDWGLAKDLGAAEESLPKVVREEPYDMVHQLTVVGAVLGTPAYMSPEQAVGQPVDARADVYALGTLLYHVLAGVPPYSGGAILDQVRAGPPPPLEERQKGVPRELAAIVRKAMARRPEERYPTARELAEDLRRFETGQLVSAQHYSKPMLVVHWLERYRAPASMLGLCLLAVIITVSVSFQRVVRERNTAEEQRALALKERALAEERANELILVQARNALDRDPTATLAWLKTHPMRDKDWEKVRDLAVEARERGVARHLFLREYRKASFGSFSPDGERFVSAGPGRTVRVWDVRSGAVVAQRPHPGEIHHARFAPDGRTIAIIDWEGTTIDLWDSASGELRTFRGHEGLVSDIRFSRDGGWLISGGYDGTVRSWSLADGSMRRFPGGSRDGISGLSLGPDGHWAMASQSGNVYMEQGPTGARRLVHAGRPGSTWVCHSPDGKWLAFASNDGAVWLWDVTAARKRLLSRGEQKVSEGAFSPDSRLLAVPSFDGTIRLWDLSRGTARVLRGPLGEAYVVAFSGDGKELASGGQDGTVHRWNLGTGAVTVLRGHAAQVFQVAYASDGRWLASTAHDGTTRLWELPEEHATVLSGHVDDLTAVAFSPHGDALATASRDMTVRLWGSDGRAGPVLRGHTDLVWRIAFSPDGQHLASGGFDHSLRWWDTSAGTGRVLGHHEGVIWAVLVLDGGATVASAGSDGRVRLWTVATGESRVLHSGPGEVRALAASGDGRWLAWAGDDRTVYLHERATGLLRQEPGHEDTIYRLGFSPDGRWLASAGWDGTVRLWPLQGGEAHILGRHNARVRALAFAPDGRWLASAGEDGRICLWSLTGLNMRIFAGHEAMVRQVTFSPDGAILASGSWDGTVHLWNVATGATYRILHHEGRVVDLAFDPTGQILASVGADDTARLWGVTRPTHLPSSPSQLRPWLDSLSAALLGTEGSWFPATGR